MAIMMRACVCVCVCVFVQGPKPGGISQRLCCTDHEFIALDPEWRIPWTNERCRWTDSGMILI